MSKKKPPVNYSIDEKHIEILTGFEKNETEIIPSLRSEKEELKRKITSLHKRQTGEYMEYRDRIFEINQQIKQLRKTEKSYLLENSPFIFDYFEQKKQISATVESLTSSAKAIHSFFKIKSNSNQHENISMSKYDHSKRNYQQYWRNVTNELTNQSDYFINTDVCDICNTGELVPQDEEGILICNNKDCSRFVTYIVDNSKPNNKDPPNEVSYTAYIRLNHFKEILSQFQAKETTQIPEDVINAIRARIKKERIVDLKTINYDKMREILRKLGLNKYFEHIQYINSLFGIKPPVMNEELHETLCVLFIEIQKPWAVHCPPNRTNFFNYTYTLYQLCVLLDQTQYLPYIPMMKDREKQLEQDMIWKKVCNDLDWFFFPSV